MKKIFFCMLLVCSVFFVSVAYADNGFYDQPYPHGITPISEPDENGWFNFVDEDGSIGTADFRQIELLPQDTIESIPTVDLVKSVLNQESDWKHSTILRPENIPYEIESCMFTYNAFYEMIHRDDLTASLFAVYADNEEIPPFTGGDSFLKGAYLEFLMIMDQIENGVYSEEENIKLESLFASKPSIKEISEADTWSSYVFFPGQRYHTLFSQSMLDMVPAPMPIEDDWSINKDERVSYILSDGTDNNGNKVLERLEGFHSFFRTSGGNPVLALFDSWYIKNDEVFQDFNIITQWTLGQGLLNEHKGEKIDIVGPATPKYNCHSWAWFNREEAENLFWIFQAAPFIKDANVTQVFLSEAQPGDILVYGEDVHSAVVMNNRDWGEYPTLRSKWGVRHLVDHLVRVEPYYNNGRNALRLYRVNK